MLNPVREFIVLIMPFRDPLPDAIDDVVIEPLVNGIINPVSRLISVIISFIEPVDTTAEDVVNEPVAVGMR